MARLSKAEKKSLEAHQDAARDEIIELIAETPDHGDLADAVMGLIITAMEMTYGLGLEHGAESIARSLGYEIDVVALRVPDEN